MDWMEKSIKCGYVVVDAETEKDAIELTENMGIRWIWYGMRALIFEKEQ